MAQVIAVSSAYLDVVHEGKSAVCITMSCNTAAYPALTDNVWESLQELASIYKVLSGVGKGKVEI